MRPRINDLFNVIDNEMQWCIKELKNVQGLREATLEVKLPVFPAGVPVLKLGPGCWLQLPASADPTRQQWNLQ